MVLKVGGVNKYEYGTRKPSRLPVPYEYRTSTVHLDIRVHLLYFVVPVQHRRVYVSCTGSTSTSTTVYRTGRFRSNVVNIRPPLVESKLL